MRAQNRPGEVLLSVRVSKRAEFPAVCRETAQAKYIFVLVMIVKFKKINREIKILMALRGQNNTIKLLDIVKY